MSSDPAQRLASHLAHIGSQRTPRLSTVPNQPKTQGRSLRVPDERYDAALAKAKREGKASTFTELVNVLLVEYIERPAEDA